MPRWVMSSPIHISSTVPAVSEITIRNTCGVSNFGMIGCAGVRREALEQEDVADRLREREADGEVARVLRDARLADLALLGSFSSEGTTTVSSCRMIDAVMYGMIPSANSAIRLSPPPLNVFSRLRIPPLPNCFWISLTACTLIPGTGMCDPTR